jgi:hypothetical protein
MTPISNPKPYGGSFIRVTVYENSMKPLWSVWLRSHWGLHSLQNFLCVSLYQKVKIIDVSKKLVASSFRSEMTEI